MQAYGAGVSTLVESSGLQADVVKAALVAHKVKYPKTYEFDATVAQSAQKTRQRTMYRTDAGFTKGVGFYRSCTGTIYHFLETDSQDWMKDSKGIMTSFSPTCIKNYPGQGLGGEIMQVGLGRIFRHLSSSKYSLVNHVKLINTVHDSVYFDISSAEIADLVLPLIASILEDVSPYFNKTYGTDWDTEFPVDVGYGSSMYYTDEVKVTDRNTTWLNKD